MTFTVLARRARLAALVGAAALFASCGGGDGGAAPTLPTPPVQPTAPVAVPGTLTISLTTPNTDDGAMLLEIAGPASVAELTSPVQGALVYTRANGNSSRVAVFGSLGAGALLRFSVPDVNAVQQYAAQVIEAADRGSALRANVTGYKLTIAP
jgi:hypothetical protein